jgi:hypothetical protein
VSSATSVVPPSRRWLVLGPALVVPFLASLVYFVFFSDSVIGRAAYAFAKAFILLWPPVAVFLVLKLRVADLREYKAVSAHLRTIPLGAMLGLAIAAAMFLLMEMPLGRQVLAGAANVREKARGLGFADHFIPFAIFVCTLHSLIEEYYWRWFVYGNLRHVLPRPLAHGLAAIAFSAHHLVVTLQFFETGLAVFLAAGVGVGGLIWSLLYQRQGSLLAPWICHMIVDIGLMVVGHRLIFE